MPKSDEQYLISSVLRDGDFAAAMKAGVTPAMFHGFGEEWEWLENYWTRFKKPPTKLAFKSAFPEFRIKAANDTGHFADAVRKSHARHEMTVSMREAAEFISDGDVATAIETMQKKMIQIAAGMGTSDDSDILRSFDDIMTEINDRRERFQERGSAGIPTGFTTLDERTGGPAPGEMWVVAARLGEGKSWMMQRMAAAAVMNGYRVQFDALEQTRAQVAMRIYSMLSGSMGKSVFNSMALMQGKDYDPKLFNRFVKSLQKEIKGNLHVADASRGKVSSLTIASQIERNKPDIVFVDYITLMAKKSSEWQGVAELSSELVQVGTEYGVPIVAASQLNRESGVTRGKAAWNPPGAEALSQADAIGQDATAVLTMSAPSVHTRVGYAAKMRNAENGFKWYMHFDPGHGKFTEIQKTRAEDIADADKEISEP
jgi:replicative DNA helicase